MFDYSEFQFIPPFEDIFYCSSLDGDNETWNYPLSGVKKPSCTKLELFEIIKDIPTVDHEYIGYTWLENFFNHFVYESNFDGIELCVQRGFNLQEHFQKNCFLNFFQYIGNLKMIEYLFELLDPEDYPNYFQQTDEENRNIVHMMLDCFYSEYNEDHECKEYYHILLFYIHKGARIIYEQSSEPYFEEFQSIVKDWEETHRKCQLIYHHIDQLGYDTEITNTIFTILLKNKL